MTIPGGLFDTPMMGGGATTPIDQMIQHLVPPQPQAPQPQPAPQGQSILGKIHDFLMGAGHADVPQGYEGLVRPDQMPKRPGLLQVLASMTPGAPSLQQGNLNAAQQVIGGQQLMTSIAERQRVLQARQQMAKMFPLQPGASLDDVRNNIAQQYNWAVQNGDVELIKDLGDRMSTLFNIPKQPPIKLAPGESAFSPTGEPLAENTNAKLYPPVLFTKPDGSQPEWVQPGQKPPAGKIEQKMAQTNVTVQGANDRAANALAATQNRTDYKNFMTESKDIRDRAGIVNQGLMTLNSALNNPDPAERKVLYKTGMTNFVQSADQKANLRQGILEYFDKIDPSIGGSWATLRDRLMKGERPEYQLQGMLAHLQNLRGLLVNEYNTRKTGAETRNPDVAFPEAEEFFPGSVPGATPPPAGPGRGGAPSTIDQRAQQRRARFGVEPRPQ